MYVSYWYMYLRNVMLNTVDKIWLIICVYNKCDIDFVVYTSTFVCLRNNSGPIGYLKMVTHMSAVRAVSVEMHNLQVSTVVVRPDRAVRGTYYVTTPSLYIQFTLRWITQPSVLTSNKLTDLSCTRVYKTNLNMSTLNSSCKWNWTTFASLLAIVNRNFKYQHVYFLYWVYRLSMTIQCKMQLWGFKLTICP